MSAADSKDWSEEGLVVTYNVESTLVTKVGWHRHYWRHGYAAPYVYPPAYGYYAPAYPYAYSAGTRVLRPFAA